MRKYYKLVAICLIAVFSLGMLSACNGRSYSEDDKEATGKIHGISKPNNDVKDTVIVGTNEETRYVDGNSSDTPNNDNPGSGNNGGGENTPGNTPGDTPSNPENPSEENEEGDDPNMPDWTTTCMTYNVLEYDTSSIGFASPATRAPWIIETINKYDPDLLGCQEVTRGSSKTGNWNMYEYLVQKLGGEYGVSGLMDSKGKPGSNVPITDYHIGSGLLIFWKKDRFELKDSGAMAYTNDNDRHYQWVKLYDKKENITVLMTNTHFSIDPNYDVALGNALRSQQANELYQFWKKNCQGDMALYATGDYNLHSTTTPFSNLSQGQYVSSRDIAMSSNAASGVDYVFINGDVQDCFKYHRCNEIFENGVLAEGDLDKLQYRTSDHNAIIIYSSNAYR